MVQQDFQLQLALLEHQNKDRLARSKNPSLPPWSQEIALAEIQKLRKMSGGARENVPEQPTSHKRTRSDVEDTPYKAVKVNDAGDSEDVEDLRTQLAELQEFVLSQNLLLSMDFLDNLE